MAGSAEEKAAWLLRVLGVQANGGAGAAARLAALEPRYQAALRAVPAERGALVAAWEFASEQAAGGNAAGAGAAIARLEARIADLLAAPAASDAEKFGIRSGIVAERRAELEAYFARQIADAKAEAAGEIGKLTRAMEPFIEDPKALVAAVRNEIARLLGDLQADVDKSLAAGNEDDVGDIVGAWYERVEADPVVAALRDTCGELEVDLSFDRIVETLTMDAIKQLKFAAA